MRIGYTIAGRTWMYTHASRAAANLSARHSVLNQGDLLAPLGIDAPPDPGTAPVEMAERPKRLRRTWRDQLADAASSREHRSVVMHVSASNPFRRWPAESFAEWSLS